MTPTNALGARLRTGKRSAGFQPAGPPASSRPSFRAPSDCGLEARGPAGWKPALRLRARALLSPFRRGESVVAALCVLAVALTAMDGARFEWSRDGGAWRIVTCHFTHWTYEQLAWDALAFAGLGIACAQRNLRAFHATLLASVLLIPLAVFAFAPHVSAYRGLSGIDSALFALLLVQTRRSPLAIVCAIGFVTKIAFEAATGGAVFATNMGTDVIAVPVAHVAGAIIGALTGTIDAIGASYTGRSCASSSPCSSH